EGVDSSNSKAASHVTGQNHVYRLVGRTGVENGLNGINACQLAVGKLKAGWSIHPGIGRDDKPGRGQSTDPDGKGTQPVYTRRETIPAIQVDTEEEGLQEEG